MDAKQSYGIYVKYTVDHVATPRWSEADGNWMDDRLETPRAVVFYLWQNWDTHQLKHNPDHITFNP